MKPNQDKTCRPANVAACLNISSPRRVRARGLQEPATSAPACRPGPLTGRWSKPAVGAWSSFALALALWLGGLPSLLAQAVPDRMNYQGVLLQGDGTPVPAVPADVEFRIYDTPTAPTGLQWGRMFRVTPDINGLFNVVLSGDGSRLTGAPDVTLASVFGSTGSDSRYLELTVVGSTPIRPRQRFVASPYAFLAHDVTAARQNFEVANVLTAQAANVGALTVNGAASVGSTVTASNFVGYGTIPIGGIIMWSGTTVPPGWALCDGSTNNGVVTPDLRGRFVLASGSGLGLTPRTPNQKGGEETVVLNMSQLPLHTHKTSLVYDRWPDNPWREGEAGNSNRGLLADPLLPYGWRQRDFETTGAGQQSPAAVNNIPPYYVLAFIMRIQ